MWGQATLTKTGLVTPSTYGPLGINEDGHTLWYYKERTYIGTI
jgi:hypothetical protein